MTSLNKIMQLIFILKLKHYFIDFMNTIYFTLHHIYNKQFINILLKKTK